jgi:hypothetical protein
MGTLFNNNPNLFKSLIKVASKFSDYRFMISTGKNEQLF